MDIFVQQNGQQTGPFDEATVRTRLNSGELAPTDLAWRDGNPTWVPLNSFFNGNGASQAPIHHVPPPFGVSGVEGSQQQKAFAYVQRIIKKGQSAAVVNDLKSMDFKAEVLPFDGHTISLLKSDFTFWAVTLLAIIPLCLVTLSDTQSQLVGFCMFFATIWGVLFKKFIVEEDGGWKLPVGTLFFTGLIGINVLLLIYRFLPDSYVGWSFSDSKFSSLLGNICQVGVCEEICKITPVLIYLAWKRKHAQPLTIVLLGVFSGLGFAAFENLSKVNDLIAEAAHMTDDSGAQGLSEGVKGAMVTVMFRSISSVFGHAVYSGIFAYFIALAHTTKKRYLALFIVGWLVAAIIHGLYDWFWSVQTTFPALITAFGFVLFYAYLTKLRLVMASTGEVNSNAVA